MHQKRKNARGSALRAPCRSAALLAKSGCFNERRELASLRLARRRFALLTFAISKVGVGQAPRHNRDYAPPTAAPAAAESRS